MISSGIVILVLLYFVQKLKWEHTCGPQIRAFTLLITALVIWRNATYGYNYFFDVAFHLDRVLLIGIFILSFWRPVFLVLVLPLVFFIQGQLSINTISYSPAELSIPIKLIAAFCTLIPFTLFLKRRFDPVFIWLATVVVMSHYWTPAYSKFLINWHEFGEIHNMLAASYAGGWLDFLDTESISSILKNISRFDKLAMIFTLVFETAVVFALLNRWLAILLLILASVFHIVVFVMSGIWFWQWLLIDLAFVYFLLIKSDKINYESPTLPIYTRIIATILIALSPFWMGAARLGWHDSPVSYIYQLRAVNAENNITVLTPTYFTPYEYPFALNSLRFLSQSKTLDISWGATRDLKLVKKLTTISTKEGVLQLIENQGLAKYDAARARNFDFFITEFVSNKQSRAAHKPWFDYLPAPQFLYTKLHSRQTLQMQIQRVEVHRLTSWFDGVVFQTIDDTLVRTIDINADK